MIPVRETDLQFSRGESPRFFRIIEDKPKACCKVTPTAEETERAEAVPRSRQPIPPSLYCQDWCSFPLSAHND